MECIKRFPSPNGHYFVNGSVVIFDGGENIAIIIEMYKEDGHVLAVLQQPSGRIRKRTLDFDAEQGIIRLLPKEDADQIRKWYKSSSVVK